MNFLKEDEIPLEHVKLFDYGIQELQRRGKKNIMCVQRGCISCNSKYFVPVSQIRGDLRRGRSLSGECSPCKKNGTVITGEGYVWISLPDHPRAYSGRYVPEHIHVMEQYLGRYLNTKTESVNHINGDHADNRIENLQLRKAFHGKGQAWECQDCGSTNVTAVELK